MIVKEKKFGIKPREKGRLKIEPGSNQPRQELKS